MAWENDLQQAQGKQHYSAKAHIVQELNVAIGALANASQAAQKANPMAADVPVFQRITAMQKEIGAMMLEVNKVKGLT